MYLVQIISIATQYHPVPLDPSGLCYDRKKKKNAYRSEQ